MDTPLSDKMGLPAYTAPNVLYSFGPEIRNIIYDNVFDGDVTSKDSLALIRASKGLHLEAGSHFYARNNFTVDIPSPAVEGATVLSPINDRYLRFLKEVSIQLKAGCAARPRVQETAGTIHNLTEIGAKFNEISLLVEWPPEILRFLKARCDDATLDETHPITTALDHLLSSGVSRSVRIVMNGAWFVSGVVTAMKGRYRSGLRFVSPNQQRQLAELSDPAAYERPLIGCYSCKFTQIFDLKPGVVTEVPNTPTALDFTFGDPILDLETDSNVPLFEVDEDMEDEKEEELNDDDDDDDDDDDVDIDEDLIPLEDGEAAAILDQLEDEADKRADQAQMSTVAEFPVMMAPQCLFPGIEW